MGENYALCSCSVGVLFHHGCEIGYTFPCTVTDTVPPPLSVCTRVCTRLLLRSRKWLGLQQWDRPSTTDGPCSCSMVPRCGPWQLNRERDSQSYWSLGRRHAFHLLQSFNSFISPSLLLLLLLQFFSALVFSSSSPSLLLLLLLRKFFSAPVCRLYFLPRLN